MTDLTQPTLNRINEVQYDKIESELDSLELDRLFGLRRWLDLGRDAIKLANKDTKEYKPRSRYRCAPSIIIRSEAELFGISMPRFAYREIFEDSEGNTEGFVNLRRIDRFTRAVGKRLEVGSHTEFLAKLRQNCRCIADSVFAVPSWAEDFHVITTDLAKWYAEDGPAVGTPFVTHFPIGGGMCAQAVCFMASALLHAHAKGVFGVAEVTMLASQRNKDDEIRFLNFSGLDLHSLERYFKHKYVGLFADVQSTDTSADYQIAIDAYVRSGFPVIVPLDMRHLRRSVYHKLPLGQSLNKLESTYPERHAVLVVGTHKRRTDPKRHEFLIHDPATFPYVPISAEELFIASSRVNSPETNNNKGIKIAQMLPVTPSQHQGGLLAKYLLPDDEEDEDLLEREMTTDTSRKSQTNARNGLLKFVRSANIISGKMSLGNMWLIDLSNPDQATKWIRDNDANENLKVALQAWYRGNEEVRWVWLKVPSVLDAKSAATVWQNNNDLALLLQFNWVPSSRSWQLEFEESPKQATTRAKKSEEVANPVSTLPIAVDAPQLKLSLISSFCVEEYAKSEWLWSKLPTPPDVERYVWMQHDVDLLLDELLGPGHGVDLTAVEALAAINPQSELMKSIENRYQKSKFAAVAMATFIPEIAESPTSERGRKAQKAIKFLGQLAVSLNQIQQANRKMERVRRIELVAGSRIGKVYQSLPFQNGAFEFVAEVLPLVEVHRNIAENLNHVLQDETFRQLLRANQIVYVMEQEPGPLFAIGVLKAMSKFCRRLEKEPYSEWKDLVGLNMDIAHWQMSNITSEKLARRSAVRMRIAHAHIAGHHPNAHFGDCLLDQSHEPRYRDLVSVLRNYNSDAETSLRKKNEYPAFSGQVSLEFEAAPTLESVMASLEAAHIILKN